MWHVTSARNRASIDAHGLDWTRMGAARGIAGSTRPEVEGVFLGTEGWWDVQYFCRMNNTGGTVDVWSVHGVSADELVQSSNGYFYVPRTVGRLDVELEYVEVVLPEPPPQGGWTDIYIRGALEPFRHHRAGRRESRRRR